MGSSHSQPENRSGSQKRKKGNRSPKQSAQKKKQEWEYAHNAAAEHKDVHLFLGPTGSGKTSLMNLLLNFNNFKELRTSIRKGNLDGYEGIARKNLEQFENGLDNPMQSQTNEACTYSVQIGNTIHDLIDTPGFGDTRGADFDKGHVEAVVNSVKATRTLRSVILVLNGRNARLDAQQSYVLSQITAILPQTALENIFLVFTNTADDTELNFRTESLEEFGLVPRNELLLENPFCKLEKIREKTHLQDRQIIRTLKSALGSILPRVEAFFDDLSHVSYVNGEAFMEVYKLRQSVERNVIRLHAQYEAEVQIKKEMTILEEEIEAYDQREQLNAAFNTTNRNLVWETHDTKHYNTLCTHSGCYSVCHKHCGLKKMVQGGSGFLRCSAFSGDTCRQCNHGPDEHFHNEIEWVQVEKVEELLDEDMKEKFRTAKDTKHQKNVLLESVRAKITKRELEMNRIAQELEGQIGRYQEIAVATNYEKLLTTQIKMLDTQIKSIRRKQGTNDAKELQKVHSTLIRQLKLVQGIGVEAAIAQVSLKHLKKTRAEFQEQAVEIGYDYEESCQDEIGDISVWDEEESEDDHPANWTTERLVQWMGKNKTFKKYVSIIEEESINGRMAMNLDTSALVDMGFKRLDAVKILEAFTCLVETHDVVDVEVVDEPELVDTLDGLDVAPGSPGQVVLCANSEHIESVTVVAGGVSYCVTVTTTLQNIYLQLYDQANGSYGITCAAPGSYHYHYNSEDPTIIKIKIYSLGSHLMPEPTQAPEDMPLTVNLVKLYVKTQRKIPQPWELMEFSGNRLTLVLATTLVNRYKKRTKKPTAV